MTEEDAKKIIKHAEEYFLEISQTKDKAIEALVAAGLVDNNGQPIELIKE